MHVCCRLSGRFTYSSPDFQLLGFPSNKPLVVLSVTFSAKAARAYYESLEHLSILLRIAIVRGFAPSIFFFMVSLSRSLLLSFLSYLFPLQPARCGAWSSSDGWSWSDVAWHRPEAGCRPGWLTSHPAGFCEGAVVRGNCVAAYPQKESAWSVTLLPRVGLERFG